MPNAECRVIEPVWGHVAPMKAGDIRLIDAAPPGVAAMTKINAIGPGIAGA